MAPPKLLVVEDDFLIRLTLSETLVDEGFAPVEAGTGDEAAELLRSDPGIALLITDVQLPGSLDGRALARLAREMRPDMPIIYMSGRPDPSLCTDPAKEVVVAKPYLPSELCQIVRRLLA